LIVPKRVAELPLGILAQAGDIPVQRLQRAQRLLHGPDKAAQRGLARRCPGHGDGSGADRIQPRGKAARISRRAEQRLQPVERTRHRLGLAPVAGAAVNGGLEKAVGDPHGLQRPDARHLASGHPRLQATRSRA
jgi:hypothetical protein